MIKKLKTISSFWIDLGALKPFLSWFFDMPFSVDTARILAEPLVTAFFRDTAGDWRSERRYYTLKER